MPKCIIETLINTLKKTSPNIAYDIEVAFDPDLAHKGEDFGEIVALLKDTSVNNVVDFEHKGKAEYLMRPANSIGEQWKKTGVSVKGTANEEKLINSFGNPFMVRGIENEVDRITAKSNEAAAVLYYRWLTKNIFPIGYEGDLELLDKRRNYILNNLHRIKNAEALKYTYGDVKEDVNAVKVLVNLSEGEGKTPKELDSKVPENSLIKVIKLNANLTSVANKITDYLDKDSRNEWGKDVLWYGPTTYAYSGITHDQKDMPQYIKNLAKRVEAVTGKPDGYYNSVLINRFKKGQKIGPHSDNEQELRLEDGSIGSIAVLTLGGNSKIGIHKKGSSEVIEELDASDGSIYTMPAGTFQDEYLHSVGSATADRISVTFRKVSTYNNQNSANNTGTGFQGYVRGFDSKGKGTPAGDGKDKAMREVADSFIGELDFTKITELPNGKASMLGNSTLTSFGELVDEVTPELLHTLAFLNEADGISTTSGWAPVPSNKVIMLARNGSLKGKALNEATKDDILMGMKKNNTFVVGDMPGVDTQFIEYLNKIGASYQVYTTNSEGQEFDRKGIDGQKYRGMVLPETTTEQAKRQTGTIHLKDRAASEKADIERLKEC